jgi:HECT-domain (ubiquitin-transferase)
LTYKELERLVCGLKTVDLELLRANTKLSPDLSESSNKVKWLWEILNEFSDEEKVKFVKFCWAQERLPSTHEEFQKLQVVFMIKSYLDKGKIDQFPKADTCFFSIELPEYSSKDIMKKKILQAINLDNVSINADKVKMENQNINSNSYNDQLLR